MILTDTDNIRQRPDKFWLNSWISKLSSMLRLLRVQSVLSNENHTVQATGLILLPHLSAPTVAGGIVSSLGSPRGAKP